MKAANSARPPMIVWCFVRKKHCYPPQFFLTIEFHSSNLGFKFQLFTGFARFVFEPVRGLLSELVARKAFPQQIESGF